MRTGILIADSGATKTEWRFVNKRTQSGYFTQGISPYFMDGDQVEAVVKNELLSQTGKINISALYYYGTGCANPDNVRMIRKALRKVFPDTDVQVTHDLMGAARALCGNEKGIACILGTGSNSCYYDGKKIVRNSPGLGYVLGDEGSGAYLGKKVLQYYLYGIFDDEMAARFDARYVTNSREILENVYKKPLPNRYLAGFALFLAENRGHFMIENIIEDGLNDFFFNHLSHYKETNRLPVSFTGSIAHGFSDVIQDLCKTYGFQVGRILRNPMDGLVDFHLQK